MPAAPSVEDLAPLLGESNSLDEPTTDPYAEEDSEFMSAARAAVGGDDKANALKDAIESCLRSHGLLTDEAEDTDEVDTSDVGAGFEDL